MRLGKLILQLCALFIAGAILVGAYAWYRDYEVEKFVDQWRARGAGTTPQESLEFFERAPAMVCRYQSTGFDLAEKGDSYFYGGKSFFTEHDLVAGARKSYMFMEHDVWYVWASDSKAIIRLTPATRYERADIDRRVPVIREGDCEVWWSAKELQLPAKLPIIDYEDL